jgi:hypothetical protein
MQEYYAGLVQENYDKYHEIEDLKRQLDVATQERDGLNAMLERRAAKPEIKSFFDLEPIKRGVSDSALMASVRVANPPHGRGVLRQDCTARLLMVFSERVALDADGNPAIRSEEAVVQPSYLKWSANDGAGKYCTFTDESVFDLALIDADAGTATIQTAAEELRDAYTFDISKSHTFVVEVVGGVRAEKGFLIETNRMAALAADLNLGEPLSVLQKVKFVVSPLWQHKALERLLLLRGGR